MDSLPVRALLKLARIDASLLAFATLFLPFYAHTGNFHASATAALPLFSMAMSAFILNDLNDIEKDRINHPERPLPQGRVAPYSGTIAYFATLATSLVLTKFFVPPEHVYLYLLFLILVTNYNLIVRDFAYLKNIYVAIATLIPLAILAHTSNWSIDVLLLMIPLGLFTIGREMLLDTIDARGDGLTLVKLVHEPLASRAALLFIGSAVAALALLARGTLEIVAVVAIAVLYVAVVAAWRDARLRPVANTLTKLQVVLSLSFLV